VEQAETALGAEMRMAAEKEKGTKSADKSKDKIVRRYVMTLSVVISAIDPASAN